MMSDERFFSDVKSKMFNYAPEVPAAAYGMMRRKLWWSNFTKLNATRFNMWYLILLIGAGSVSAIGYYGTSSQADRSSAHQLRGFQISPAGTVQANAQSMEAAANISCSNQGSSCVTSKCNASHNSSSSDAGSASSASVSTPSETAPVVSASNEAITASSESTPQVVDETQPAEVKKDVEEAQPVDNSRNGKKKFKVTVYESNSHK